MAGPNDDPVTSWRDRTRNRTLTVVPVEIDVRRERPPPPLRLSPAEKQLWQRLVDSRRPGWFSGALEILETYVLATLQVQRIEAELRKLKPSTQARYQRLARLHRQSVAQASLLATRLRLTPSARIDKSQPQVGDVPIA